MSEIIDLDQALAEIDQRSGHTGARPPGPHRVVSLTDYDALTGFIRTLQAENAGLNAALASLTALKPKRKYTRKG